MSPELEPHEISRRAAAVNEILGRIGLSQGAQGEWWNYLAYEELGGRTPTQAWLDGDFDVVVKLVEGWYRASERAGERHQEDPELMALLRERHRSFAHNVARSA